MTIKTLRYNYKDKFSNVSMLNNYMLAKTLSMFEYENLPESLPYRELEKLLQTQGYAFVTEHEGQIYAFTGGLGGVPDVYGNATEIVVSNPALKLNKTFNLKNDGVLIINDDMHMGLIPLYDKHHTLMVENDINIVVNGYNSRMQKLISAPDDKTKASAELYVKRAIDGDVAIIGENGLFDGIRLQTGSTNTSQSVTQLIEFNQYIKASLYNEMGLSSNFNMKRERLITSEVEAGEDSLFPFVFNMMKCRLKGVEQINAMFNTDIKVDFGSVWHFKNAELVDDVVDQNKLPDEATGGEGGSGSDPDTNTNTDPEKDQKENTDNDSQKTVDELKSMLLDESLSDEDKQAVKELLSEMEQKD